MKRIAKLATAAAMLVLLSGCAVVSQAGAAAIVGENRLTNEQVDAQFNSILTALGDAQSQSTRSDLNRQIVSSFVFANLVQQVADDLGIKVTAAEVAGRRTELTAQAGSEQALATLAAQSGFAPENIDRTILMSTQFSRITARLSATGAADDTAAQGEAYKKLMEKSVLDNVQVSARYGSWDSNTLQISELVNDMSVTAAEVAASATQ